MDGITTRALDDAGLIRQWRVYAFSLEAHLRMDMPTMDVARGLGYIEREMEWRNIRHDDPRGDVLDSQGTWHKP